MNIVQETPCDKRINEMRLRIARDEIDTADRLGAAMRRMERIETSRLRIGPTPTWPRLAAADRTIDEMIANPRQDEGNGFD